MSKPKILVVEDDFDISNMLKIYFTSQDFEVDIASRGSHAMEKTRQGLPHLIILDIMLPDIDGYEVCRQLRTNKRTSHIPIIFLTQKDERSDKLQGLELGADDYITKPFDIEELKLRVKNAIARAERDSLTDPRSGLPSGRLIENQLRDIIRKEAWCYIDLQIDHFEAFKDSYGFVAGDDVLRFAAIMINEVIEDMGNIEDFIGHTGGNNFVLISSEDNWNAILEVIKNRFKEEVLAHYNFIDREQGHILFTNEHGESEQKPLMSMSAGIIYQAQHEFADIRQITELAAEARRLDTTGVSS